jgi:hypothetical protein
MITTTADAECFIRLCVETIGSGFHPDTPAADYETDSGERLFDEDGATYFDARIDETFALCDPYEVALAVQGAA